MRACHLPSSSVKTEQLRPSADAQAQPDKPWSLRVALGAGFIEHRSSRADGTSEDRVAAGMGGEVDLLWRWTTRWRLGVGDALERFAWSGYGVPPLDDQGRKVLEAPRYQLADPSLAPSSACGAARLDSAALRPRAGGGAATAAEVLELHGSFASVRCQRCGLDWGISVREVIETTTAEGDPTPLSG